MEPRARLLLFAAAAASVIAFLRRPVKPPEATGSWHPAERQRTRS